MSYVPGELLSLWQRRRALTIAFGLTASSAWLLALPVVLAVVRSGVANHPAADAPLFDREGFLLIEVVHSVSDSLDTVRTHFELAGLALVLLSPFVLVAWCISAPDEANPTHPPLLLGAIRAYPAALSVSAAVWFVRAVLLLIGGIVAGVIRAHVDGTNDRTVDISAVLALGCCVMVVSVTPSLRDVAVVHALRANAGTLVSLRVSLSVMASEWRPLLARLSLLYCALACVALLGLYSARWFTLESRGLVGSLTLLLGGPTALAGCVVIRASCIDQARRSHRRWRQARMS